MRQKEGSTTWPKFGICIPPYPEKTSYDIGKDDDGDLLGWGGVFRDEAAELKETFEKKYGGDPKKFFDYWPQVKNGLRVGDGEGRLVCLQRDRGKGRSPRRVHGSATSTQYVSRLSCVRVKVRA